LFSWANDPEGMLDRMLIRDADVGDWPQIWSFFQPIATAGETYCYDRAITHDDGRALWFPNPGRTVVAVEGEVVVGSAKMYPNHPGPGSHVASASFMVDPGHSGSGVGRALGIHVIEWASAAGYRAMQFNAVVETNRRAVALWESLGFKVLTTVPEAFNHPTAGFVGLHIMHRRL
jgi:GNAT superfamily N-acetyltransferase